MAKIVDWDARIGGRVRLRDLHILLTVVHCGSMAVNRRPNLTPDRRPILTPSGDGF